jgi:hypothetical protein
MMCKILSYSNRSKSHARFVIDLPGSLAAIDTTIQLKKARAIGVYIGHFSPEEAMLYATDRMPGSFTIADRKSMATSVVEKFDGLVLTLETVCEATNEGPGDDVAFVEATIKKEQENEEKLALDGWKAFCSSMVGKLNRRADAGLKQAAILLMEGPKLIDDIVTLFTEESDTMLLTAKDIGLSNADAGYHPLAIDPFEVTVSLSGKAMERVFEKMYN